MWNGSRQITAEGARSLGQDVVASSRDGVEQNLAGVPALAGAMAPEWNANGNTSELQRVEHIAREGRPGKGGCVARVEGKVVVEEGAVIEQTIGSPAALAFVDEQHSEPELLRFVQLERLAPERDRARIS